jgi:hypothetical protein
MANQSQQRAARVRASGPPKPAGTLLAETRRWKRSSLRRMILPAIKAFEKKRRRKVERARVYGQLARLSKLAALKRCAGGRGLGSVTDLGKA